MFEVGTKVYWTIKPRADKVLERAGVIVGIVPAEVHPNTVSQRLGYGKVVDDKVYVRTEQSYLVQIPNRASVFWLGEKVMELLPEEKTYLLQMQSPSQEKAGAINRGDRLKIKKLCKKLGYEFTESRDFLYVPDMRKRFVFQVTGGEEFVASIEQIRGDL